MMSEIPKTAGLVRRKPSRLFVVLFIILFYLIFLYVFIVLFYLGAVAVKVRIL